MRYRKFVLSLNFEFFFEHKKFPWMIIFLMLELGKNNMQSPLLPGGFGGHVSGNNRNLFSGFAILFSTFFYKGPYEPA